MLEIENLEKQRLNFINNLCQHFKVSSLEEYYDQNPKTFVRSITVLKIDNLRCKDILKQLTPYLLTAAPLERLYHVLFNFYEDNPVKCKVCGKATEFTKQFSEQIACENREPYIFKYDGKYIASCDLVFDYGEYTEKSKKIYLSRLIVKKEYRDKGIGQEVLKQMINLCKNKDYKYITLGVDTDNANAVHIYKKNGFKIYETDIDKYGKYYKMILTI